MASFFNYEVQDAFTKMFFGNEYLSNISLKALILVRLRSLRDDLNQKKAQR